MHQRFRAWVAGTLSTVMLVAMSIGAFAAPAAASGNSGTVSSLSVTSSTAGPTTVGQSVYYSLDMGFSAAPSSGETIDVSFGGQGSGFDLSKASVTSAVYSGTTSGTTAASLLFVNGNSAQLQLGDLPTGVTNVTATVYGVTNPTTAGTYAISVEDPFGSAPLSRNVSVTAGSATSLKVAAPASETAGTPFDVAVAAYDQYGNIATGYTGTITLTTNDGNSPSKQAPDVGTPYTFTSADQGQATTLPVTLYNATGSATITASDGTLSATSGSIAVSAAVAADLVMSGPPNIAPNVTDGPFTLQTTDQYGNPAPVASATTVSVSGNGVSLYAWTNGAVGATENNVAMAAGVSSAQFGVKATTVGSTPLTYASNPALNVSGPYQLAVGVPATVAFANGATQATIPVMQRIPVTISVPSGNGDSSVVLSAVYNSNNIGSFYLNPSDATPIANNTVSIAAGKSQTVYYAEDTQTQLNRASIPVSITADDGAGASSAITLTVVPAGTVAAVALLPNDQSQTTITASKDGSGQGTSTTLTIELQDQYGNAITPSSDVTVGLQSYQKANNDPGTLVFAQSGQPVTSVTLTPKAPSVTVSVYDPTAGDYFVTLTGADIYSETAPEITVNPAAQASQIVMSLQAAGTNGYPVTLQLEDQYGNVVTTGQSTEVALNSSATGGYFTDLSGNPITQIAIPSSVSSVSFYYVEATGASGTTTLTASSAGLASGTGQIVDPTALTISGIAKNTWYGGGVPITFTLSGPTGAILHPLATDLVLNLTATGGATFESGGSAVTSVTIPAGSMSADVNVVIPATSTTPISVTATPASGSIPAESVTINTEPLTYVSATLYPGWNAISVPFVLANPSFQAILGSSESQVASALAYQNGAWVQVTSANEAAILSQPMTGLMLDISGNTPVTAYFQPTSSPNPPPQIALTAGWNLVGPSAAWDYGADDYQSYADFLANTPASLVTEIVDPSGYNYPSIDPSKDTYDEVWDGFGYWVYSTGSGTLIGEVSTPVQ